MTERELEQFRTLHLEIKSIEARIAELDKTIRSPIISDMPYTHSNKSSIEEYVIKNDKLLSYYNKRLLELRKEEEKLYNYIDGVQDDKVRVIMRMRYIDGMKWEEIATTLNYERTNPHKIVKKYLKKKPTI